LTAAQEVMELCGSFGAKTILNAAPTLLQQIDAAGIHLTQQQLSPLKQRPIDEGKMLGVSCHNLAEIQHAQQIGADYISLSPVLPTTTHPEANPLGWPKFSELVGQCAVPVFALGGMQHSDFQRALDAGAQGIAGVRLFNEPCNLND